MRMRILSMAPPEASSLCLSKRHANGQDGEKDRLTVHSRSAQVHHVQARISYSLTSFSCYCYMPVQR